MGAAFQMWLGKLAGEPISLGLVKASAYALVFIVALRAIAAAYSAGSYHPDEHFQILEMARSAMGLQPKDILPWEYSERMRPGLQPWLAAQAYQALAAIGLENPSAWTFVLRLFAGVAGGIALWAFTVFGFRWLSSNRIKGIALWLAVVVWFLPFLQVRFSSENMSASCMAVGFMCLLAGTKPRRWWPALVAGFLMGLAFQFRYQSVFFSAPIGILLLVSNGGRGWLAPAIFGVVAAFGLGALADYWLYGGWCFPPYEYSRAFFFGGKAPTFDTSPFWQYFAWLANPAATYSLWGLFALAAAAFLLKSRPKHPLVIGVWVFLIFHTLVAHKEFRFLFPLAIFLPIWLSMFYQGLTTHGRWGGKIRDLLKIKGLKIGWRVVVVANGLALFSGLLMPADKVEATMAAFESATRHDPLPQVWVMNEPKPIIHLFNVHTIRAYLPPTLDTIYHDTTYYKLPDRTFRGKSVYWFVDTRGRQLAKDSTWDGWRWQLFYQQYPDWVHSLNFNGWLNRSHTWVVYKRAKATGG